MDPSRSGSNGSRGTLAFAMPSTGGRARPECRCRAWLTHGRSPEAPADSHNQANATRFNNAHQVEQVQCVRLSCLPVCRGVRHGMTGSACHNVRQIKGSSPNMGDTSRSPRWMTLKAGAFAGLHASTQRSRDLACLGSPIGAAQTPPWWSWGRDQQAFPTPFRVPVVPDSPAAPACRLIRKRCSRSWRSCGRR